MTYKLYAMDTYFHNSFGVYGFEAQCEMLAELGYDATYLSLWSLQAWADVRKLPTVPARHGLSVAGAYVVLDCRFGADAPGPRRILDLLQTVEGCTTIELGIQGGGRTSAADRAGTQDVLSFLDEALAICEARGIDILLYPHMTFWMQRHEDAVAICEHVAHPRLGIVFCGFHWYGAGNRDIDGTLELLSPYLRQANLAGSRKSPQGWAGIATIEPLDEGELDNFVVLGALQRLGYEGLIGFQGWEVGGDIYAKLERSITAFRSMEDRIERHPEWSRLCR